MSRVRIELQPAWVLHARPYRDTSLLLEIFSRDHGRVGLVARGARRPRARLRALLQPLQPLLLSWQSAGELGTLTHAEADGAALGVRREVLFAALYANELLLRLSARQDPHPALYREYGILLQQLARGSDPGVSLRIFERDLLQALGYGLNLTHEATAGVPLAPQRLYTYDGERGACTGLRSGLPQVHGAALLALARGELLPAQAAEVKPILQQALRQHLGSGALRSARLLRDLRARLGSPSKTLE